AEPPGLRLVLPAVRIAVQVPFVVGAAQPSLLVIVSVPAATTLLGLAVVAVQPAKDPTPSNVPAAAISAADKPSFLPVCPPISSVSPVVVCGTRSRSWLLRCRPLPPCEGSLAV